MSASAILHAGAEEIEIMLRMQSDSVGAPIDPASRYVSLWPNSARSSRRGFADRP